MSGPSMKKNYRISMIIVFMLAIDLEKLPKQTMIFIHYNLLDPGPEL